MEQTIQMQNKLISYNSLDKIQAMCNNRLHGITFYKLIVQVLPLLRQLGQLRILLQLL